MDRHLVTTADERTWSRDIPIVFLGEWCRRYNRYHSWASLDYEVSYPLGKLSVDRHRGILQTIDLAEKLLPELSAALNKKHGTSFSLRYWRILIGHWLLRFVSTAYHRYHTLQIALEEFCPTSTTLLRGRGYQLATMDSKSFIWATDNDFWNQVLWGETLLFLGFPEKAITYLDVEAGPCFLDITPQNKKYRLLKSIPKFLSDVYNNYFFNNTDAFIVGSYLPFFIEAKFHLNIGQLPRHFTIPKVDLPLPSERINALPEFDTESGNKFEKYTRRLVSLIMPACFLEGYSKLTKVSENINWPNQPKFIFTCSNYDLDELFKTWAAAKVESGIPYYVGQHGNNYGTHMFFGASCWPERSATDAFLTWGWSELRSSTIPAFNFKLPKRSDKWDLTKDGGLLLIESSAMHSCQSWDVSSEHHEYLEHQFRFVSALNLDIKSKLIVRLHADSNRLLYCETDQWADKFPDLIVDKGSSPISKLLRRSRLVVHSYDSTGILEMLAANQPFICFWPNGFEDLNPTCIPAYASLYEVGIFQDSPENAAKKIVEIWDDISSWWLSQEVQNIRQNFCEMYSKQNASPASHLAAIFSDCLVNFKKIGK